MTVQEIAEAHRARRDAIRARLDDFRNVPEKEYLFELLYCLLTPQSSALNAGRVIAELKGRGFEHAPFDPEPFLRRKESYIRFHRTKAKRLLAAREQFSEVARRLAGTTGVEARQWLVHNVNGLGWKEASHFLRNIGYRDLAILDRHILKHLLRAGVIRKLPAALSAKQYQAIERKFRHFAETIGIPMDELDLLFWSMETGNILK